MEQCKVKRFLFPLMCLALCTACATSDTSTANTATATKNEELASEFDLITVAQNAVGSSQTPQPPAPVTDAATQSGTRIERRIIRNATLTIQANDPAAAGRRVAAIAETSGGFVSSNETSGTLANDDGKSITVIISVRVPSGSFNTVLEQIRATGTRTTSENITGQDVTEEYIDLEARIRTKQALEAQFLEILKRTQTVADALAVQKQVGDVRTEIEQLEGRRRFLADRVSLSTITVTLETPTPFLATRATSFFTRLARAFGGGVDIAATIFLVLVRVAIALLPLIIFVGLPLVLISRYLRRRRRAQNFAPLTSSMIAGEPSPIITDVNKNTSTNTDDGDAK